MAARPGEEMVATLFADVHYFYSVPTVNSPHHRFDKASYVYLFENATQRRARIEIANHPGTADQDAFDGYLDGVQLLYSYKHSNLVSFTVGQTACEEHEWQLPAFNPSNETKYMYKLHTVDIYFWTRDDALQFVNGIRRVIPPHQAHILDEPLAPPPPPPPSENLSSVVQKLEHIAVSDPSYQLGTTHDSRSFIPRPPISAVPHSEPAASFAPMAYNPAAPAAPETIAHREKTPPPEDSTENLHLLAASSDKGLSSRPPYFGAPQEGLSEQPPPATQATSTSVFHPNSRSSNVASSFPLNLQVSLNPLPTAPQVAACSSTTFTLPPSMPSAFAPPPSSTPSVLSPLAQQNQEKQQQSNLPPQPLPSTAQPSHGYIPVTQYAQYPFSPGMSHAMTTPSLSTPNTPGIFSPSASPTPGGFSQYSYHHAPAAPALKTDYSIHQQVYRAMEEEVTPKVSKPLRAPTGRLEERASKLEKGVGSLLKKLEKKIG